MDINEVAISVVCMYVGGLNWNGTKEKHFKICRHVMCC